jgi:flagellar hook assembly protein FlgD
VFAPNGTFANDHVAIGFTLGRSVPVTVKVYNRAGRLVRELMSGETMGAGANLVRWDGRDDNSETSPDGLYIISVEAMGQRETKTISVVR